MKNADIHNGLPDAIIRDFLAHNLDYMYNVESLERELSNLLSQLKKAKQGRAARKLMTSRGWIDFDVSDAIEDYEYDQYFPFVGTDEEWQNFIPNKLRNTEGNI